MSKRGYLGIDESNNSKNPEIYVVVLSRNSSDAEERTRNLKKGQKTKTIREVLRGKSYSHILVSSEIKNELGARGSQVMAISELIKHYRRQSLDVIVDGCLDAKVKMEVQRIIYPIVLGNFISKPKADIKFRVVNQADYVARLLHRYYKKDRDGQDHLEFRIQPEISDYLYLKRFLSS